jgi:hypothetical protein
MRGQSSEVGSRRTERQKSEDREQRTDNLWKLNIVFREYLALGWYNLNSFGRARLNFPGGALFNPSTIFRSYGAGWLKMNSFGTDEFHG